MSAQQMKQRAARRGEQISHATAVKRAEQSRVDSAMAQARPRGRSLRSAGVQARGRGGFNFGSLFKPGDFAKAGSWIGNAISKITGMGDYTIQKNSIIENLPVGPDGQIEKKFSFSNFGSAHIRCEKREFLATVVAPAVNPDLFAQTQYRLQATDANTFPWLSGIAAHFTEWELKGAIFSFETTSTNYSASVGLGTVALATQYNANMLPYADMESMLQSAYHTRGNPAEDMLHGIECDPKLQAAERLYTRRPGASGPPNLYDHGVVTIATEGLPAAAAGVVLGRLYVTYDVALSLPELPVVAPYQHELFISQSVAMGAGDPPIGPLLATTADPNSELTVGIAAGSNVLLVGEGNGPAVKPTLTPADENVLFGWINQNSTDNKIMYVSFARAGNYLINVRQWVTGGPTPAGNVTAAALQDSTVELAENWSPGATDSARLWSIKVVAQQAGAVITVTNAGTAVTQVQWQMVCQ